MMYNPKTKLLLDAFIARPSSSLLLAGATEPTLHLIVEDIASQLIGKASKSSVLTVAPDEKGTITIEQVRELKTMLRTQHHTKDEISLIVHIASANTATIEAQNALLKLIEEPNQKLLCILSDYSNEHILRTIQSRCQTIPILPITQSQAEEFARTRNIAPADLQRSLLLSNGEALLFEALATGENSEHLEAIQAAKQFMTATVADRLQTQKKYEKSVDITRLLHFLEIIARTALHTSNNSNRQRWIEITKEITASQALLKRNASAKLVFLRLCLSV